MWGGAAWWGCDAWGGDAWGGDAAPYGDVAGGPGAYGGGADMCLGTGSVCGSACGHDHAAYGGAPRPFTAVYPAPVTGPVGVSRASLASSCTRRH
ncbi:hypothetical protein GCM10027091_08150 [Streptomyces daliensis]